MSGIHGLPSSKGFTNPSNLFQHISPSNRLWTSLGLCILLSLFFVYIYEKNKSPKLAHIPRKDLALAPGQVSYLLLGLIKADYILAATLLDWKRRGLVFSSKQSPEVFFLNPQAGPMLENETYLMNFLLEMCPNKKISFSSIRNRRLAQEEDFYQKMSLWFHILAEDLRRGGLLYKSRRNHGDALVYLLLSIAFYFLGFIGLFQKIFPSLIVILGASLYFWLSIYIYNAPPPKGQAVYQALRPLKKGTFSSIKEALPFLDEAHIYLYTLSLGRYLEEFSIYQGRDRKLLGQIREAFIGKVSYQIEK